MQIVQWSARERTIGRAEARGFFEAPLHEPWLFHFTTSCLRMEPHAGAFSLKLVLSGEEEYRFGRRRVEVKPGDLLFVPAGREYSSTIARETESVAIFLPSELAGSFWRDASGHHDAALEGRSIRPFDPLPIAWRAPPDAATRVRALRHALLRTSGAVEHAALDLLVSAAEAWRATAPVPATRGPRRQSTREELVSRAMRARDMIEDLRGLDCRLDQLADAACLSRFHLIRVFKQVYGRTPGEYARTVRLRHAAAMIDAGEEMGSAARANGYSRPSTLRRARRSGI